VNEDQFLEKALALIGEVKKTANKLLQKDTFIKVFKYTGEFAKYKIRETK